MIDSTMFLFESVYLQYRFVKYKTRSLQVYVKYQELINDNNNGKRKRTRVIFFNVICVMRCYPISCTLTRYPFS